ncbi:MAG: excinuclease ABC subunit A, partial [Planctomycetales bacterium]|nr:excinuclease ABC subunit A [Planctomycetales bacterium]
GEAQRVKMAKELWKRATGRTLYSLDEPTTGLHFDDLAKLLDVLNRLVDLGNSVVVIEHNLDVIKTADWIIDIGPEAGRHGGQVVACGTPEMVVEASGASVNPPPRGEGPGDGPTVAPRANRATSSGALPSPNPSLGGRGTASGSLRSHTAEALAPVLAQGPYKKRKLHTQDDKPQAGDLDLEEVGKDIRMPWEVDGREWHCENRVSRAGDSVEWDGRILDRVEERIQELGEELGIDWAPTNWNHRSIVEVTGEKKTAGWFFHAITAERWLVKLKFRTAKKTFQRDQLVLDLDLKPLNDLNDIEAYGSGARVKCKNLRGPWQEVQVHAHSYEEIDTPEFWSFLKKAAEGFKAFTDRTSKSPDDIMPWKVMGQKWHLARKGFPPGKKPAWTTELLEELFELLEEVTPKGQFLWNNKVLVHRMAAGKPDPWATVVTKRLANVELALNGPKCAFQLGRVTDIGKEQELTTDHPERDTVRLRFVEVDDLHRGDLEGFLREHLEAAVGAPV